MGSCTDPIGETTLTRLQRLHKLLAAGRDVDGWQGADALEAAIAEIQRLRAVLDAIDRHSVNTIRSKSRDVGDWIDDMGFVGKLARGQ